MVGGDGGGGDGVVVEMVEMVVCLFDGECMFC